MGSEKNGIDTTVMKKCNYIYKIPMLGFCDSVNVSVATGIVLYEIQINNYFFNDKF